MEPIRTFQVWRSWGGGENNRKVEGTGMECWRLEIDGFVWQMDDWQGTRNRHLDNPALRNDAVGIESGHTRPKIEKFEKYAEIGWN